MPKLPTKVLQSKPTPYWQSKCGRVVVWKGDNREVMRLLDADSVHAVVSDPPYGLEFMGKEWDAPWKHNGKIEGRVVYGTSDPEMFMLWFKATAVEILRVAKPGAHFLSFGGTRMFCWMGCAIVLAGWEMRDTLGWLYGSGFPKSHDVSKAIDRAYGVERDKKVFDSRPGMAKSWDTGSGKGFNGESAVVDEPVTAAAAAEWQGWGSALKPAWEPIIMSRKPLVGTIAQNTLEHGCGGINVDGCRVGTTGQDVTRVSLPRISSGSGRYQLNAEPKGTVVCEGNGEFVTKDGRWPANIVHDGSDEVLALFPESSSTRSEVTSNPGTVYGNGAGLPSHTGIYGFDDNGSAARFFYTAKADKIDRGDHNKHPTVKPVDLMQYLCRLVTPPDGIVLDPFMGSGSTGVAAICEGFRFVGIEQSEEYCDIAVARLQRAMLDKGMAQAPTMKAVDVFKRK